MQKLKPDNLFILKTVRLELLKKKKVNILRDIIVEEAAE
jgi:hypothetical protein